MDLDIIWVKMLNTWMWTKDGKLWKTFLRSNSQVEPKALIISLNLDMRGKFVWQFGGVYSI